MPAVAIALISTAALIRPIALVFNERLAAQVHYYADEPHDPWGSEWLSSAEGRRYSPGPDRSDDLGAGDDILIPLSTISIELCWLLPRSLMLLATLSIVLWVAAMRFPSQRTTWRETLASGTAAVAAASGFVFIERGRSILFVDRLDLIHIVPASISTVFSLSLLFWIAVTLTRHGSRVDRREVPARAPST